MWTLEKAKKAIADAGYPEVADNLEEEIYFSKGENFNITETHLLSDFVNENITWQESFHGEVFWMRLHDDVQRAERTLE